MIAIVDYKAGNLTSVKLAVEEIGRECVITSDRDCIMETGRVIFPGVGAAGAAMKTIKELGLDITLKDFLSTGKPLLGICLGAQIVLDQSLEDNLTPCLGLLPGTTALFQSSTEGPLKVPQIGWNQVSFQREHPVFGDLPSDSEFYFVHSYYPVPAREKDVYATTTYGATTFASVLGQGSLIACQFHPEKSGRIGLQLLENFCQWEGR